MDKMFFFECAKFEGKYLISRSCKQMGILVRFGEEIGDKFEITHQRYRNFGLSIATLDSHDGLAR
jgi:hypothetical protein